MRILINFIKSNFLSGLAILIPFIITIYLVMEIGTWLNSFVDLTPARFVKLPIYISPVLAETILFLVALCCFIIFITLLGLATKNLLGKFLLKIGEKTQIIKKRMLS